MRLVMRTLNEYLRQKRLDSGLSQLDVAQALGYASPQFVSNWEARTCFSSSGNNRSAHTPVQNLRNGGN